ncbi:outer membrane protein assembly factor BamE [SAR116 cluster bacterium]|nr:outer membrane protein assembly factor BamE [SAR116 cluster bacterium]
MTRGLFDALLNVGSNAGSNVGRHSKWLTTFFIMLALGGCGERISSHGHTIEAAELDLIKPGETTRFDLESTLGRASFEGAFGSGKIYYVSEIMVEPAAGRKQITSRTIVAITFDDDNIVTDVEIRDETTGNVIAHLDQKTPTPGDTYSVAEQMFSTLRRRGE